jgi:transposase
VTIVCDLERHKTIASLPDREPATAQGWLSDQPQIEVVARDRGGGYALAAARALPRATQVADRWHLMENASRAFLDAVRKSMRQIRSAIGAATINPNLLTAAERIQYEGYLRREEANTIILGLAKNEVTIKEIVRRTGHSRGLVRKVLRVSARTYSASGRVRSRCICNGLTNNGRLGTATAPSCGGGSRGRGFAVVFALSASGHRAVAGRKRPTVH